MDVPRDFRRPTAVVVTTQLAVATLLGAFALLSFSILLKKLPRLYASRKFKDDGRLRLPSWDENSLFGWMSVLYKITDEQVLEYAGLDAYVFLSFFKMCIKLVGMFCFFSLSVISPVRHHFTGSYDDDPDDPNHGKKILSFLFRNVGDVVLNDDPKPDPEKNTNYLWMYVVFTYFFTFLAVRMVVSETKHVVNTRQTYLGRQNTVTDRTLRLTGIPIELRDTIALKTKIEQLKIGTVSSITICREWGPLNRLFHYRHKILKKLELRYAECPPSLLEDTSYSESYNLRRNNRYRDIENPLSNGDMSHLNLSSPNPTSASTPTVTTTPTPTDSSSYYRPASGGERPRMRTGIFGKEVDAIDYLEQQLKFIDHEIVEARRKHYSATPTAFITMDSVANAQMAAQTVLDPRVHYLITRLAPASHDIKWDNACLSRRDRLTMGYSITIFIGISSVFLVLPVSYLATLLNLKTLSKFWPSLGQLLQDHKWASNIVTGLLPTYLFTLLNVIIPYFYEFLTFHQGLVSHGEQEISLVSKNFFYIFVNLFLVFTLAGTASTYWAYLSDTAKIAYQLAASVRELSLFYVDLIILQGIGMFPFKLLLVGQLIGFPLIKIQAKTPRQRRELYSPPIFNFGLQLPQSILIMIITLIYSVMSTRILLAGLAYFIMGFYVYKYQLIFATDHLPHSTGRVWPLVFRRLIVGLLLFQLTMAGTLAGFESGWILSSCLFPLPFITLSVLWDFERNYLPLLQYIALSSIREHERDNSMVAGNADESYSYPYLIDGLEGPMVD